LSFAHAADNLLTLLAVENVLGQYSCRPVFRGGIVSSDVKWVVPSGRGVVREEREAQVILVLVFFVGLSFIVDGGVKGTIREWLPECERGGVSVVDMHC